MPNPLIRRIVTSKEPRRQEPVLEHVAGHNNPYRGLEQHGIETTNKPGEELDYHDAGAVVYEELPPEPDPVPVIVVTHDGRERKRFRAYQYRIPVQSTYQVLPFDDTRSRMVLRNTSSTVTVYVGTDGSVNDFTGYPLEGHAELTMSHYDDVYIYNADLATVATIGIYVEYAAKE